MGELAAVMTWLRGKGSVVLAWIRSLRKPRLSLVGYTGLFLTRWEESGSPAVKTGEVG